jgi:hypothetical protein
MAPSKTIMPGLLCRHGRRVVRLDLGASANRTIENGRCRSGPLQTSPWRSGGETEAPGVPGNATFVYTAKGFKNLIRVPRPRQRNPVWIRRRDLLDRHAAGREPRQRHWARSCSPRRRSPISAAPARLFQQTRTDRRYRSHRPSLLLASWHHALGARTITGSTAWRIPDCGSDTVFQADDHSGNAVTATFSDHKIFGGSFVAARNASKVGGIGLRPSIYRLDVRIARCRENPDENNAETVPRLPGDGARLAFIRC